MSKFKSNLLFIILAILGVICAVWSANEDAKNTTLETITTTTGWKIHAQFLPENNKVRTTIWRENPVPADAQNVPVPPFPITILVKESNERFEILESPSDLLVSVPASANRLTIAFPQFRAIETESIATLSIRVPAKQ